MQECSSQDHKEPVTDWTSFLQGQRGRESMIANYCRVAIRSGHEKCIWLCIKRGRKYNLVDIPLESNTQIIGLKDISQRYNWWKRFSLYSVVGVKEVMVRVLEFDQLTQRISVVVTDFDHTATISRLVKAKETALVEGIESGECGIDIKGQRHSHEKFCANATWDPIGEDEYCKLEHLDSLDLKRESYKWLTPMLEYYWQNGIDAKGMAFLQTGDFVTSYESLIYDEWFDAANPYGRTLHAFLAMEGWNTRLLLQLVGICVFLTICVVSVVTAAGRNLEIGLTAGSYAVGLLAVLLAAFTLLSAII